MAEAERRATTGDRPEAAAARQATQARQAAEGEVMTHPTGPAGTGPAGGAGTGPKGHTMAMAAQAVALVAVGLVLIAAALTAPAAPAVEPMQTRPATEQERRDYDVRQLSAALDEMQRTRQQEGATSAATAVTPESRTRTNHAEEGRSR